MRRILSITAILALMSPVLSPLVAVSCPHAKQAPACHRAHPVQTTHHCDAMMHEHQPQPAAQDSGAPAVKAIDSPANCPMDCCVARHITSAAAIAAASFLPELVAAAQARSLVPVTFISAGFSSHTDRGPPNT